METIQTFRPKWEDFQEMGVLKYIEYMESKGAHHAGIAKVSKKFVRKIRRIPMIFYQENWIFCKNINFVTR